MMKKYLALALIAPLLISCSSSNKKGDSYNEAWVKDTNGFDILMGQFAHNIENIWGFNEVLIAGPKDYVKYTDQYQTRSHINFDAGTITIETIAGTEPAAHLRKAIIKTLLMGDDPGSIDLYSDVDDIQISKQPFLYGQVVDNNGEAIRWQWRAEKYADYLLQNQMKSRTNGLKIIYSVTINLVANHLDKRAHKYVGMVRQSARKYGVDESLILAIMQTERCLPGTGTFRHAGPRLPVRSRQQYRYRYRLSGDAEQYLPRRHQQPDLTPLRGDHRL